MAEEKKVEPVIIKEQSREDDFTTHPLPDGIGLKVVRMKGSFKEQKSRVE